MCEDGSESPGLHHHFLLLLAGLCAAGHGRLSAGEDVQLLPPSAWLQYVRPLHQLCGTKLRPHTAMMFT